MLLTSLPVKPSQTSFWHMAAAYLGRWRLERIIRFLKQSYQLQAIRILTYVRLQNIMALLMAAAYFTSMYIGLKLELSVPMRHMLRVFGIPDFRFYALADCTERFLFSRKKSLHIYLPPPKSCFVQGLLFDL